MMLISVALLIYLFTAALYIITCLLVTLVDAIEFKGLIIPMKTNISDNTLHDRPNLSDRLNTISWQII